MCFTIIYSIFFSYSTNKTESPCTNPRYTQCLKSFSYLLTAVMLLLEDLMTGKKACLFKIESSYLSSKKRIFSFFFVFSFPFRVSLCSFLFLFVAGNATYKSPCRSVCRSVPLYFFGVFELFEGRIARVLASYGC